MRVSKAAPPTPPATPHLGPNMTQKAVPTVRIGAHALVAGGATLVAGHSAHVFQDVAGNVIYDLGGLIDDSAVDPWLRNDLGLLFLVDLISTGPLRLEAIPIFLDHCRTRIARGEEAARIGRRFTEACAEMGTQVQSIGDRLVIECAPSGALATREVP